MQETADDKTLVRLTAEGRRDAFDLLVRRHQSAVRRFLLSLTLGNESLCDDLAQETFLKAYLNIGKFRAASSFQTWLMRIAYNTFYDYKRANKLELTDLSAADAPRNSRTYTQNYELMADIYHALSLLKDEERTCITLQLIQGETIEHIAQITGMGGNTVKSHLKRGKERLANYLKQNGYDR